MNSILYNPAETELDIRCVTTETALMEDMYSTTPLISMRSFYQQSNEDELHSSFEDAISDRVLALNKQLRHLSIPLPGNEAGQSSMSVEVAQPVFSLTRLSFLGPAWRKVMLTIASAFILIMIGFDLMGLLILLKS